MNDVQSKMCVIMGNGITYSYYHRMESRKSLRPDPWDLLSPARTNPIAFSELQKHLVGGHGGGSSDAAIINKICKIIRDTNPYHREPHLLSAAEPMGRMFVDFCESNPSIETQLQQCVWLAMKKQHEWVMNRFKTKKSRVRGWEWIEHLRKCASKHKLSFVSYNYDIVPAILVQEAFDRELWYITGCGECDLYGFPDKISIVHPHGNLFIRSSYEISGNASFAFEDVGVCFDEEYLRRDEPPSFPTLIMPGFAASSGHWTGQGCSWIQMQRSIEQADIVLLAGVQMYGDNGVDFEEFKSVSQESIAGKRIIHISGEPNVPLKDWLSMHGSEYAHVCHTNIRSGLRSFF